MRWLLRPHQATTLVAHRRSFLEQGAAAVALVSLGAAAAAAPAALADDKATVTTSSGLQYSVVREGKGMKPVVGDLAAIRFQGSYKGVAFDDILTAAEPFYYRVGSNRLLKVPPHDPA
jgi:FKBP-type peptidyl-prolyl cis-trans isomerase